MTRRRVRTIVVTCLLMLGIFLLPTDAAQASKAPKSLTFDASGAVEVMAVYETSYAAQKSTVKALKLRSKLMKKAAGFLGTSTLKRTDGKQVIALSQWQDVASYQAYIPPAGSMSADGSAPPAPTRTLVFELEKAEGFMEGITPALRGKQAVVQLSQFAAKTADPQSVDAQSGLLSQVEQLIPAILQKQPIPQSVLLLKGLDGQTVALMVNWNCSAVFEDVGQPAAIAASSSLLALVDSDQQQYDVVTIIPAEVKEDADD